MKRCAKLAKLGVFGIAGVFATAVPASAQSLDDKYWIELGAFLPNVDSEVRVQSTTNPNIATTIDFENDLALKDRDTLPSITAGVRIGSNFSIGAEYYSLHREGSRSIAREIVFDDTTYAVGATLGSEFNSDIYRLTVGYEFIKNENFSLGGALGLHATQFEVALSGQGTVNGTPGAVATSRRKDLLAPLPTIGLFGAAKIIPGLTANARVDFLSLKIDDYKGRLINAQVGVTYRFIKNVGVGVAYRYVDYRVDVEKERWTGRLAYQFSGPSIFLQVGF